MPTPIVVPEMGESVVEATVTRWLKKEGDPVAVGDVLLELETEKVNLEVGSEHAGVLAKIERQAGADVKVGEVLGVIEEGATAPKPARDDGGKPSAPSAPQQEVEVRESLSLAQAEPVKAWKGEAPTEAEPPKPPQAPTQPQPQRVPDKAEAVEKPQHSTMEREEGRQIERVRMSRRRRTIARNLVAAQQTAAMLTTFNEIDMRAVMELRQRQKESFREQYGVGLGISSFFVKAVVAALRQFPMLNAEIQGEEILYKHFFDIGVAIDTDEGLVVPVLRDADRLSFAQIEQGIKTFASKGQAGTLSMEDLRGGCFTITNGGVFGSLFSTPILNLPQVGILGLHKIEERPVALKGQVVIHPMMYVALSYDHRLIDGREAVQFLATIKQLVEDPGALLLKG